jgi:hypothetical protein
VARAGHSNDVRIQLMHLCARRVAPAPWSVEAPVVGGLTSLSHPLSISAWPAPWGCSLAGKQPQPQPWGPRHSEPQTSQQGHPEIIHGNRVDARSVVASGAHVASGRLKNENLSLLLLPLLEPILARQRQKAIYVAMVRARALGFHRLAAALSRPLWAAVVGGGGGCRRCGPKMKSGTSSGM